MDAVTLLWLELLLDVHLGLLLDEADAVIRLHDLLVRGQARVVLICLQYSVLFVDEKAFHGCVPVLFVVKGGAIQCGLFDRDVRCCSSELLRAVIFADSVAVASIIMPASSMSWVALGLDA